MLIWKILGYKPKFNCKLRGGLSYYNFWHWCETISQHSRLSVPIIKIRSFDFISIVHLINFRRLKNGSSSPFFFYEHILQDVQYQFWFEIRYFSNALYKNELLTKSVSHKLLVVSWQQTYMQWRNWEFFFGGATKKIIV